MFQDSVVVRSGQAWKLVAFLAGELIALLGLFVALFSSVPLLETGKMGTYLGSVSLGAGAIVFLALALRCPRCRTRWAWRQMRHGDGIDLFAQVMSLRRCPVCDFPDSGKDE